MMIQLANKVKDLFEAEAEAPSINLLEDAEAKDQPTGALGNSEDEPRDSSEGGQHASEEPVPDNFEVRTYRMACPLSSKSSKEVMQAVLEIYLRLKIDGFVISRFHTDRGREFSNQLRQWFISRGVACTRTAGDNPQSNGRCAGCSEHQNVGSTSSASGQSWSRSMAMGFEASQ